MGNLPMNEPPPLVACRHCGAKKLELQPCNCTKASADRMQTWRQMCIHDPASLAGVIREGYALYSTRGPGCDIDSLAKKIWEALRGPARRTTHYVENPECPVCHKEVWK